MFLYSTEMRLQEGGDQDGSPGRSSQGKGPHLYDDPYDDSSTADFSPVHRQFPPGPEATDMRPKEDYDEPWEWSVKQNVMLQAAHMESASQNLPPHFLTNHTRTPQLKRTVVNAPVTVAKASPEDYEDEEEDSVDGERDEEPDVVETIEPPLAQSEDVEEESTYETTYECTTRAGGDSDDEGYTHLREEFGPSGPKMPLEGMGNYEEPWDLTSKQRELEDKIKAASDRASRDQSVPSAKNNVKDQEPKEESERGEGASTSSASGLPLPQADTRSQEGYEKPWDWKPHMKDDRSQEGYEKPWDWKPHQKDDRPQEEYEEPWDQKAKALQQELLGSSEQAGASASSNGAAASCGLKKEDPKKADDLRPLEEYDEPWDQKAKQLAQGGGESMLQS